jgi:hypothetical protein
VRSHNHNCSFWEIFEGTIWSFCCKNLIMLVRTWAFGPSNFGLRVHSLNATAPHPIGLW